MDYKKIGNFIMTERKAKKLTQKKLAEMLFVSEKTISKWENGNGLPDTNTLPRLCEIFDITINELLNGERITNENYVDKAENKLFDLQKMKEASDKRNLLSEIVIGSVATILFLIILSVSLYAIKKLNVLTLPIIMIVVASIIFVFACSFCLYIEQKAGFYVCNKCNHKYVPSFRQVFFAPHINRTRYMKCPCCKKRSWSKKVIN